MNKPTGNDKSAKSDVDIVYVDLDALLDTRLGTLAVLNDIYAVNALENGYLNRTRDEFPDVSYEVFKKAYEKRNVETLKHSTFTNVFVFLKSIIKSTFEAAVSNGNVRPLRIQINTHPYDLVDEEKAAICQAVAARLREMVDVEVIGVPDNDLTPQHCKNNFAMMIRYEYEPWLKIHLKAFEHIKMPELSLIGPAIYQSLPNEQEMAELKEKNIHPFMAAEFGLAPFVSLKLLDADVFSISTDVLKAAIDRHDEKTDEKNDGIKPEEVSPSEPKPNTAVNQDDSDDGFEML